MKIACIGGGPAGLYLGILMKLASPRHAVTVLERDRAGDALGFGLVLSEATLANLADADPFSHAALAEVATRWDDLEVHVGGEVVRSTGHGFVGVDRRVLLDVLARRAAELGVEVVREREVRSLDDVAAADVVVGADGAASWVRGALAEHVHPTITTSASRHLWLATARPSRAFTFALVDTPHGLLRVHAYPHAADASTVVVECPPATWQAAGFADADEARTLALVEELCAEELGGRPLRADRAGWRTFATIHNRTWQHGNVVLIGDAAHTAHFSIGSGTKLALEDAIALRDALVAEPDVDSALATYEMKRRPEVELLQAAAEASRDWFDGAERYRRLPPAQRAYSLLTRSLRVGHESVQRHAPPLARAVEELVAHGAGLAGAPPPPMFVPATLAGLVVHNRVALAPWRLGQGVGDDGVVGDAHLVFLGARASGGVGLVMTETVAARPGGDDAPRGTPRLGTDDQTVAWRRVVDFVHSAGARIGVELAVHAGGDAHVGVALADAARRAGFAGFDLLVVHLAVGPLARWTGPAERPALTDALARAREAWPAGRPLGVRVLDGDRDAAVALLADLRAAGVDVAWVAPAAGPRASSAAPLADRLRNELGLAVVLEGPPGSHSDLDALVAAGRCDVCALDRPLVVDPGFVQRAADALGWAP